MSKCLHRNNICYGLTLDSGSGAGMAIMNMKKIRKIIEYGLYLLVFLLPWQTRWIIKAGMINGGYSEYGTISLYGTDILLIILLIFNFIYNKKNNWKLKIENWELKYWWLIAGLELMIFISIFFAADKVTAVYAYLRFLLAIGLFWLIVSVNFNKIKLLAGLLVGILIQAILGISQFISQSSFGSKWLGMALHNSSDLGVSVIEVVKIGAWPERWLRAYGGLDHPNMLGGILAISLIILIWQYASFRLETNNIKLNNKLLFIFYFLFFIFILALFFTFSRGSWIGLLAGISTMLGIFIKNHDFKKQKIILEIILLSGIMIFILYNIYGDLVSTRFFPETRLEAKSLTERATLNEYARGLIKNHWLFGVGIGNFTQSAQKEIITGQPSYYYQPAHNTFLLVLAEIGVIGLLFFISLLIYLFIKVLNPPNPAYRQAGPFYQGGDNFFISPILLSLIVMMTADHWWWSLHFGILFFWLAMGLMVRKIKEDII
ncbi:hypothetical protein CO115_03420 [Candidatus Falkowbacteria bacterium CG_4_9_14_3_um_filter_36_9]|uniref:O-antigen ligase-related domain-containing protein n=2 Tax=Candidatus Falkowiibacteriota TaxID=1752728 RepID=A0A1J4T5T3_9BACT|nr:MAG: hypothetical protein AUJ27_03470 [Candidatus Falkowbacteria bacterium CG1_02_37_44]PJB19022.1 MAG: hypothetical protein CO115_03420 [Candidatus Falkowbacteria bacterium CG_4_9_14_3_um_filter_36_9]